MSNAKIFGAFVVAAVLALVLIGGYYYPAAPAQIAPVMYAGTSPQGATFNTAHFGGIAAILAAPGVNATSSSVLNTSSSDYYVTSIKIGCEGVGTSQTAYTGTGLAALTLKVATSSTAAPATNGNTNLVGGGSITIATSTTNFTLSTSTAAGGSTNVYTIWPAGAYLTFTTNATNTASCTFGADYFSS